MPWWCLTCSHSPKSRHREARVPGSSPSIRSTYKILPSGDAQPPATNDSAVNAPANPRVLVFSSKCMPVRTHHPNNISAHGNYSIGKGPAEIGARPRTSRPGARKTFGQARSAEGCHCNDQRSSDSGRSRMRSLSAPVPMHLVYTRARKSTRKFFA